jgi:small-conductance mechanosensitive channel
VLAAGIGAYQLLFGLLTRLSNATQTTLDDVLMRRMRLPARLLLALLSLHAYVVLRDRELPTVRKGVLIIELFLGAYVLIEVVETVVLFYWLGERKKVQLPALVRHLILTVLYMVAGLSIVGTVTGVDLIPLLATSTVATVVLGLALQDTLGNLFAGLALHSERAFSIGDWILVDGIEGQVVYVGWRSTRLQTFSWDIVSLPNSVIAKARMQNFYAPNRTCARNVETFVSVSASPEEVERAARRACAEVPEILKEPLPKVWLIAVTPLFQRYVIKIWIGDFARHDDMESELLKAMFRACRDVGIGLAPLSAQPALDPRAPETVVAAAAPANLQNDSTS